MKNNFKNYYSWNRYTICLLFGFMLSLMTTLMSCENSNAAGNPDTSGMFVTTDNSDQMNQVNSQIQQIQKIQEIQEPQPTAENFYLKKVSSSINYTDDDWGRKAKQLDSHIQHGDAPVALSNTSNVKKDNTSNNKVGLVGVLTLNDNDDTRYDVFRGAKGGLYIFRTSKETGNEYKSYIKPGSKLYSRIVWEE